MKSNYLRQVRLICVQCQEELTSNEDLFYCKNPACPNYKLYQVGEDDFTFEGEKYESIVKRIKKRN
jgi:hypothetical protein